MPVANERRKHASVRSLAEASSPRNDAVATARIKDALSRAAHRRASTEATQQKLLDSDDDEEEEDENSSSRTLVLWSAPEVKAMSNNRSNQAYYHLTKAVDKGQELQLSLRNRPPQLFPEYEARRLLDFFLAWTQDMDKNNMGLAVINDCATGLSDVVPPWNFAWTEGYILDPSVSVVSDLPDSPTVNGFQLTDQGRSLEGCSCEDDVCVPETCECFMRAVRKYPNEASWYARQLDDSRDYPDDPTKKQRFAYTAHGTLVDDIDLGTPIFECNAACACDKECCTNRVVQNGRTVPLAFTKTPQKGWGIKALSDIPRGTFLGVYGGELLSDGASEIRAQTYDNKLGMSYLQSLDSHVVKLFFTQRIVEEDLAERGELWKYRGSVEADMRLAQSITKASLLIEGHDEYMQYTQGVRDEVADMHHKGTYTAAAEERLWEALDAILHKPVDAQPPLVEDEFENIRNFLHLGKSQQDQVRTWSARQSIMEDQYALVVDSGLFGNYTRFYNHSCDPNLVQFPVYAEETSILRPWLAFFTSRPVLAGEELCFNYYSGSTTDAVPAVQIKDLLTEPGQDPTRILISTASSAKTVRSLGQGASGAIVDCKCGAPNCIGAVFAPSRLK